MEGIEGCIFSKAPDGKLLLLLKMKIKQNLGKNAIFKHIHQDIRTYPRCEKCALTSN